MSDLPNFADVTPRFALPLLYAAQAQKEVFVNEALMLTDALAHSCVEGERATPPETSAEGDAWLVAPEATADWADAEGSIAVCRGAGWVFIPPRDGMRVFDRSRGAEMLFFGFWRKASLPVEPVGGTNVDGVARTAINDLVSALQALGILPAA